MSPTEEPSAALKATALTMGHEGVDLTQRAEKPKMLAHEELVAKFAFASISCAIAAFATNPVDIVKVRQQLQGEGLARSTPKRTFLGIAFNMVRHEGPLSLMRGASASMLRDGTYGAIRIGLYDSFKQLTLNVTGASKTQTGEPLVVKVAAGMGSGALGSAIMNPTDLIKIRMQSSSASTDLYPNIYRSFLHIWRNGGGIAGLYRGVFPTVGRAMVITASQLASYDHIKHSLLRTGWFEEGMKLHFGSSVLAGLICSMTSAPIDVIKVRYMSQEFDRSSGKGLKYSSSLDCLRKTVMIEGPTALYKGFFMCWLRLGPHTIISLVIFEKLRHLTGINPI